MSDIKLYNNERLAVRVGKRDGACNAGWWITDGQRIFFSGLGGGVMWGGNYDSAGSLMRFPCYTSDGWDEPEPTLMPNWAYMLEQLIYEGEIRHVDATYLYWRNK